MLARRDRRLLLGLTALTLGLMALAAVRGAGHVLLFVPLLVLVLPVPDTPGQATVYERHTCSARRGFVRLIDGLLGR